MTLSPNTLPLLFRECLHGFCTGFTIETVAWDCVCCRRPSGLLITPPSKLRVCEALVSQFKTLLEPNSSSWGLSVNFFILFYFFTWSRVCDAGILICIHPNLGSLSCTLHLWLGSLTGLKICQFLAPEDCCSPKHWLLQQPFPSIKEEKAPEAKDLYL